MLDPAKLIGAHYYHVVIVESHSDDQQEDAYQREWLVDATQSVIHVMFMNTLSVFAFSDMFVSLGTAAGQSDRVALRIPPLLLGYYNSGSADVRVFAIACGHAAAVANSRSAFGDGFGALYIAARCRPHWAPSAFYASAHGDVATKRLPPQPNVEFVRFERRAIACRRLAPGDSECAQPIRSSLQNASSFDELNNHPITISLNNIGNAFYERLDQDLGTSEWFVFGESVSVVVRDLHTQQVLKERVAFETEFYQPACFHFAGTGSRKRGLAFRIDILSNPPTARIGLLLCANDSRWGLDNIAETGLVSAVLLRWHLSDASVLPLDELSGWHVLRPRSSITALTGRTCLCMACRSTTGMKCRSACANTRSKRGSGTILPPATKLR